MGQVANIDPVTPRDRAIRRIFQGLDVEAERKSNVITVRYVDRSAQHSQHVVATLLEAYQEEHLRVNRTSGSRKFFQDQSQLMRERWEESASKLRDMKNALGLVSTDVQRQLLQEETSRIEAQLVLASTQLAAATAQARRLEQIVASLPDRKITEEEDGHPNEALDGMRQQLYQLEIRESELAAKYTDSHPELIAVRDQLRSSRTILNTQDARRVRMTTSVNKEREDLHLALLKQQAEQAAQSAKTKRLKEECVRLKQRVRQLNEAEVAIARQQQEVDLAAANYQAYSENLEQARIDRALQEDRISNVNIYQPASLEHRPVSPRKGLVLLLGLAVALFGSASLVLLIERFNHCLRTPEDVERELELPVLLSLPRTPVQASKVETA
jgi:uncharacterized protein involved in exopolysaccharide biosynthesis